MAFYLITYIPKHDEEHLINHIHNMSETKEAHFVFKSTWIIKSERPTSEIYHSFFDYIKYFESIIICRIDKYIDGIPHLSECASVQDIF
jgi:hypothetical protein